MLQKIIEWLISLFKKSETVQSNTSIQDNQIIEQPEIIEEKKEMIKELKIDNNYLTAGSKNRPGTKLHKVMAIVVHWTGVPNQKSIETRNYFESGAVYGGSQYVFGPQDEKVACMPEDEVTWHCGSSQVDPKSGRIYTDYARATFGDKYCSANSSPNYVTIGIECNPIAASGEMSPATYDNLKHLCASLLKKYKLDITKLCTHQEIVGWKSCHKWFVDNPDKWTQFKNEVNVLLS